MPRNISPSVQAAIAAPQKSLALFLQLVFQNATPTVPPISFPIAGVESGGTGGVLYVVIGIPLTPIQQAELLAGLVNFGGLTSATWLNGQSCKAIGFISGPGSETTMSLVPPSDMPADYPYTLDTGEATTAPLVGPTELFLWGGIGNMSSAGPAWDPGSTFPYGEIFQGMGWLGRIESVPQTAELTAENLTLQLSGIPVDLLGDVVNTVRLSGAASLWVGLFSGGQLLLDPLALWTGALDVPTVSDGADTCAVTITVENALLALNLASNRRFTTLDQQLDYPGDTGFDYVGAMQDLYLPYPCGILSPVDLGTGVGQAPDVSNALTLLPAGPLQMAVGDIEQVNGSAFFVSGPYQQTSQPVTAAGLWSSSDTGVAIVTNGTGADASGGSGNWGHGGGLITGTGPGNCTITFFFGTVSCSITVTVLPVAV